MINILILGPSLSAVSGISTHLNQLLGSPLSSKFHLIHFQTGSQGRKESPLGKLVRFLWSPIELMGKILSNKPVIIHLNTSIDPKAFWRDAVYLMVAKLCKRKVLYQIHGGELPDTFFSKNNPLTIFLKWLLLQADAVVVLAGIERRAYEEFANIRRLRIIPNAIDFLPYEKLPKKQFDRNPFRLVYIGSLIPTKGVINTIKAIDILRNRGELPDIQFVIAGSGIEKKNLKREVAFRKLKKIIQFIEPVFGEEKIRFWQEADLFVFPTYHEGLPYAILESMASGTPLITTAVGGIPDVMQNGVHGLFIRPGDSEELAAIIKKLVSDKEKLKQMSLNCIKRIKEAYNIDRLANQFLEIYQEIITNSKFTD